MTPGTATASTSIPAAQAPRALATDVVHVWRIPVAADAAHANDFSCLLTPMEQARANRFTRGEDRARFELGRAVLRCLLARYLGVTPRQVGIEQDQAGKPVLDASTRADEGMIHFNLSHSGGWIVAAFARSSAVGIDVEAVSAKSASAQLIEYLMSDNEMQSLQMLPKQQQVAAFFKCWTSKEAFVKGLGVGLSVPLKAIEVSVDPEVPAQLLSAPQELSADNWYLRTLDFSEGYAATLALAATSAEVVDISVDSWRNIYY
jgi:4'-phosphopantetheinyl transferase